VQSPNFFYSILGIGLSNQIKAVGLGLQIFNVRFRQFSLSHAEHVSWQRL